VDYINKNAIDLQYDFKNHIFVKPTRYSKTVFFDDNIIYIWGKSIIKGLSNFREFYTYYEKSVKNLTPHWELVYWTPNMLYFRCHWDFELINGEFISYVGYNFLVTNNN